MSPIIERLSEFMLMFMAGYYLGHRIAKRESPRLWTPDPSITDADIQAHLRAGRKIEAIKLYRQRDGSGLKEALKAVEHLTSRRDGSPPIK